MDTAIIKINGNPTIVEVLQVGKFTYFKHNGNIRHMRTDKFNVKMNEVDVPREIYCPCGGNILKLNLIGFTDNGNVIGKAPVGSGVDTYTMSFKKWLRLGELTKSFVETLRKEG